MRCQCRARSSGTWVLDTKVSKTRHWNQDHLVVPLEPEFGCYIDKVILGDNARQLLPELRSHVIQGRRPLIVHPDGTKPEKHHIPRVSADCFAIACRAMITLKRALTSRCFPRPTRSTAVFARPLFLSQWRTRSRYANRRCWFSGSIRRTL